MANMDTCATTQNRSDIWNSRYWYARTSGRQYEDYPYQKANDAKAEFEEILATLYA